MKKYTHKETGTTDTREGWLCSYDAEELEVRGLTAEEAFDADEGVTLFEEEEDEETICHREGCTEIATHVTSDGTHLCDECWDDLKDEGYDYEADKRKEFEEE